MTNTPARGIDEAMSEDRPEKAVVRSLWADAVEAAAAQTGGGSEPLYLTLAGARGLDVQALIKRGILNLTESGAISASDTDKVVAVESNKRAFFNLKKAYPGLRAFNDTIENLLSGPGLTRYPSPKLQSSVRAHVVNLDFNQSLAVKLENDKLFMPQLQLIFKLAQVHADGSPPIDWTLCLTLQGETNWSPRICRFVQDFLSENVQRSPRFRTHVEEFFGDELMMRILEGSSVDVTALSLTEQQRLLMTLVPKRIALITHVLGWRNETVANIRYGGTEGRSAMCTWMIKFSWDSRVTSQPNSAYLESLETILPGCSRIDQNGQIVREVNTIEHCSTPRLF